MLLISTSHGHALKLTLSLVFQCTGFVTSFAEQETPLQRVARSDQIDVRPSAGPIHGLLDLAISQTIDPFLDVHALHQKRTQFGQVLRQGL